jgi:hypothetical protein
MVSKQDSYFYSNSHSPAHHPVQQLLDRFCELLQLRPLMLEQGLSS